MDQIAFLKQHKEFSDAGDMAALAGLEEQALTHTYEFLNGEIAAEPETAPLFYSFFRTFSDTKNKDLKTACEKALEKVQPFLDQFDEFLSYTVKTCHTLRKLASARISQSILDYPRIPIPARS